MDHFWKRHYVLVICVLCTFCDEILASGVRSLAALPGMKLCPNFVVWAFEYLFSIVTTCHVKAMGVRVAIGDEP